MHGGLANATTNDSFEDVKDYKALIRIFDIHSKQVFESKIDLNIQHESSSLILTIPQIENLTQTYFLDLRIYDNSGSEISNNFYWLSTKEDVLDYEAKFDDWAYHTPSKEYADFTIINSMPKVNLDISSKFVTEDKSSKIIINLENNNEEIAFFIELQLLNKISKELILPVLWSDNYLSLLPNEKRIIEAKFNNDDLEISTEIELAVKGWNISNSTL